MNKAYLLIGGNVGNRLQNLARAAKIIEENCGKITRFSAVYETAAWGLEDQPAFLNQALELETSFSASELMSRLLWCEEEMGRKRMEKYGPRIIDMDILLFNDEIHVSLHITVPHPALPARRFALVPLNEIAPAYKHPVLHKTIHQLLEESPDKLDVNKYE